MIETQPRETPLDAQPLDAGQPSLDPVPVAQYDEEEEETAHFEPRGAYLFVLLVLAGYAIYWFITYFEIFIQRGS